MEPKRFLNRKIVVGSAQLRSTYRMDEHAFHPSDVPPQVRAAKQAAQSWKRPSALKSLSKPDWNSSVVPSDRHRRARTRQLAAVSAMGALHLRAARNFRSWLDMSPSFLQNEPADFAFNFRAEVLPEPRPVQTDAFGRSRLLPASVKDSRVSIALRRPCVLAQYAATLLQGHIRRTQELPVHPRLQNKPAWNSTTQGGGSESARTAATSALTARARGASRARSRRLASAKQGYLTPAERESARMVALRARRTATARSLAGGEVHTEQWGTHFTSSLHATARQQPRGTQLLQVADLSNSVSSAAPAWSARPSWAASAGAAVANSSGNDAKQQEQARAVGTPVRRARKAFGASGAAAQDARLNALMSTAGGSAAWQAGYWAATLPPTPDKNAMKEAFGDERGRLTVPSEFVAPEYTLPS